MKRTIITLTFCITMILFTGCSINKNNSTENEQHSIKNENITNSQVTEKETIKDKRNSTSCETLIKETLPLEGLDVVTMKYFKNPQPQKIVPLINTLSEHQVFKKAPQMIWFFAEVFKQNPQYINSWIIKDLCGLDEHKTKEWDALVTALWMSKTKEGKAVLEKIQKKSSNSGKKYIDELNERNVDEMDPLKNDISNSTQLDILWAEFFASGEEVYVEKIIKTMLENNENTLLYSAAKWSLSSNSKQFVEVREILEKYSQNSNDQEVKTIIENILK